MTKIDISTNPPSVPEIGAPETGAPETAALQAGAPETRPLPVAATSGKMDRWAMILSGICVVHCLAIPAVALLLPTLAHRAVSHQSAVHWVLLAAALPLSGLALWLGYRRHSRVWILTMGLGGLLLMFLGVSHQFGVQAELPLSVSGALILLIAHVANLRHSHSPTD